MKSVSNLLYGSLFAMVILTSSCGPTLSPFTQNLYEDNNWTASELQQIQFYLSENIVLRRELNDGSSQIIQGEIKIVDGRKVDQIMFKKGTPGVFVFSPKENRFAVSFEDGEDSFLVFGPSPNSNSKYVLRASDWDRRRGGTITYRGQKWQTATSSAYAALLVDLDRLNKTDVNARVAGGRKVGG